MQRRPDVVVVVVLFVFVVVVVVVVVIVVFLVVVVVVAIRVAASTCTARQLHDLQTMRSSLCSPSHHRCKLNVLLVTLPV